MKSVRSVRLLVVGAICLSLSACASEPVEEETQDVQADATRRPPSDATLQPDVPPGDTIVAPHVDIEEDTAECIPTTCATESANCNTISDNCGGTLDCGVCIAPDTCGGVGVANQCGCTPTTCATESATCDTISDNCGGTLNCGGCTLPKTCGGGGTANQCGCTPTTCDAEGAQCGSIDDGCSSTLACGDCAASETCGGGGTPNVCGPSCVATGDSGCTAKTTGIECCVETDFCTPSGKCKACKENGKIVQGPAYRCCSGIKTVNNVCTDSICPPQGACWEEPGVFHAPTVGDEVLSLHYTPPNPGNYTSVRLIMDVFHGGWSKDPEAKRYNLVWFVHDHNNYNMFGYLNFVAPDDFMWRHGFDLVQDHKFIFWCKNVVAEYATYHVEYVYDTGAMDIKVLLTKEGETICELHDLPNIPVIVFDSGETMDLDFGFDGKDLKEPATYGWTYSNLRIELLP